MNGIIYCITDKNDKILYIGSTILSLKQRISIHKYHSKTLKYLIYTYIKENGGWADYIFKVLEEYVCEKIENLRIRERYYYDLHKPELNSMRPVKTKEDHISDLVKKTQAIKKNCECGGRYSVAYTKVHFNTAIHQAYIKKIHIETENNLKKLITNKF